MKELSALEYHRGTKHPGGELLDPNHRYDPTDRPPRVKEYRGGDRIDLPRVDPRAGVAALEAIQGLADIPKPAPFDLERLSRLLHFSAGVTKWLDRPPLGKIPFRAASCTGALYHIELYLAWTGSSALAPGLYHYQPEAHALLKLRAGDPGSKLAAAVPLLEEEPAMGSLLFTSDYWRNAAKYQARAYRHSFWDAGTILANSVALCDSFGWDCRLLLGFVDEQLAELLAIGGRPELPLFSLGFGERPSNLTGSDLGELLAEAPPIGDFKIDWPSIEAVHRASSLAGAAEANAWAQSKFKRMAVEVPNDSIRIIPTEMDGEPAGDSLETVIEQRGSSRRFQLESISKSQLAMLLKSVRGQIQADEINADLNELFLIVNAVEGVAPGAYLYRPSEEGLVQLTSGNYRMEAQQLALGQSLGGQAAVNMYWLADLKAIIGSLGDRGYRLAQLQAAEAAGRGYLAAYALGIGATGLTFFDDDVIEFFSPTSRGMAVMFLLAVGVPG